MIYYFLLMIFYNELPETYEEFKNLTHTLFPVIYDTRYVLEHHPGLWEEFD